MQCRLGNVAKLRGEIYSMTPRITIVTRTKNRPLLLARGLQSVGAQTCQDYQHVIVDDAHNPAPIEELLSGLAPAAREKILLVSTAEGTPREGVVYAGLEASHLEYLCIHDDDDTWEPEFLEQTVSWMDAHPDAGMVGVRCNLVKEEVKDSEIIQLDKATLRPDLNSFSLLETTYANYVPPIAQLFRRSVVDKLGFWDRGLATQADWEFNLRILSAYPAGFLAEKPLANWHHRVQTGGDMDNSVVSESEGHHNQNLMIRDSYLKQCLEQGNYGALAEILAQQVWFKRLREEVETERTNAENSRQMIHASLTKAILQQGEQIAQLHEELRGIKAANAELRNTNAEVLSVVKDMQSYQQRFLRRWRKLWGRNK